MRKKPRPHSWSQILHVWGCRSLYYVRFCSLSECFLGRAGLSASKVNFHTARTRSSSLHAAQIVQGVISTMSLTQTCAFETCLSSLCKIDIQLLQQEVAKFPPKSQTQLWEMGLQQHPCIGLMGEQDISEWVGVWVIGEFNGLFSWWLPSLLGKLFFRLHL